MNYVCPHGHNIAVDCDDCARDKAPVWMKRERTIVVGGYRYKLDRQWRRHAEAIRRLHRERLRFLNMVAPSVDEARRNGEIAPPDNTERRPCV